MCHRSSGQVENLLGGERAGAAIEAGARTCARSARIQCADWRPVPRPSEQRPRAEQLIDRELAAKRMAARQALRPLEVERRDDVPREHDLLEPRRTRRDGARRGIT